MEYNILKKKEFIFIGGILILALAMWGGMSLINKGSHGSIRITVDGKNMELILWKRIRRLKSTIQMSVKSKTVRHV